jgi:hypothetical protein
MGVHIRFPISRGAALTLGAIIRKVVRTAGIIVLGIVGYVVFGPWVPKTGNGFIVWACLLFGLIFVGIIVGIMTGKYSGSADLSEDYRPPDDPKPTSR